MIRQAQKNGAALVKFQLYDAEDDKDKPHYQESKKCELTFNMAKAFFEYGKEQGIEVFFSVFHERCVEWCERMGVNRYKIACGMRDENVINAVRSTKKPVIISTNGHTDWPLWDRLYCVPEYPALKEHIHFPDFQFGRSDGFSDHTIGLDAAKIALARGAQIIEKHFILSREMPTLENAFSMIPSELRELVEWEKVCAEVLH